MFYSKDGVSVAPVIDSCHPKQNGLYPIKIRVTYRRKRKYYPTSKSLTIEQWNNISTSKSHALIAIRKDIENSYNIVRSVVEDLTSTGYFSLEMLNMRLRGATSHTVNTAFRAKINTLKELGQVGTMMCYDMVLKGLERFSDNHINFEDVTVSWVERYADFLRKEKKAQTSISIHLRTLRAILNEAKRNGIIREAQYPFGRGRYEIQEGEGRKMALTMEQIGMIASYDDGSHATAKYRDYWLFLYLCNGINVADFVKLKFQQIVNGEICFVRQKTERTTKTRKEIRVIVSDRMQAIIDRWGNNPSIDDFIFPILNGKEDAFALKHKTKYLTKAINKRMAQIGKQLGIGNISTYTARHSFATVLKRAGVNIAYISESLGHSDLKTTENYLASFEREEREKNARLLTQF